MKRVDLVGNIDKSGNMYLFNQNELKELIKQNPDSTIIMSIIVDKSKSIELMRGYFNGVVVPRVQQKLFENGTVYDARKTKKFIYSISPITQDLDVDEFTHDHWVQFLDHVREFSKDELNLILHDVRII